jgi:hypothetical protein
MRCRARIQVRAGAAAGKDAAAAEADAPPVALPEALIHDSRARPQPAS